MSQRNPMNDRYSGDAALGKTRKSAASMKPKSKAASSVHIQSSKKSPEERKAAQKAARKAERARQAELDRKYYKPPTKEYKRLRVLWFVCLAGAIVTVAGSWFLRGVEPAWLSYVSLGLAYAFIIAAFYLDFSKIKKVRRKYQEEMEAKSNSKASKAAKSEK